MSNDASSDKNKIVFNGKEMEFKTLSGTVGPSVVDIRALYSDLGIFTYDPGYGSTGSCESGITYIDGEKGFLLHRGYPIDQLAEKSSFLEVAYLLLNGDLPKKPEKEEFENAITYHTMVHEQLINFYRGFRRDAHPMAILVGVVGALSSFYPDSTNINDPYERLVSSRRMIAKIPTIAAMAYKYSLGQPFNYPQNDLNYAYQQSPKNWIYAFSFAEDHFKSGNTSVALKIIQQTFKEDNNSYFAGMLLAQIQQIVIQVQEHLNLITQILHQQLFFILMTLKVVQLTQIYSLF